MPLTFCIPRGKGHFLYKDSSLARNGLGVYDSATQVTAERNNRGKRPTGGEFRRLKVS
mgnify:CR=1 FL=1